MLPSGSYEFVDNAHMRASADHATRSNYYYATQLGWLGTQPPYECSNPNMAIITSIRASTRDAPVAESRLTSTPTRTATPIPTAAAMHLLQRSGRYFVSD